MPDKRVKRELTEMHTQKKTRVAARRKRELAEKRRREAYLPGRTRQ